MAAGHPSDPPLHAAILSGSRNRAPRGEGSSGDVNRRRFSLGLPRVTLSIGQLQNDGHRVVAVEFALIVIMLSNTKKRRFFDRVDEIYTLPKRQSLEPPPPIAQATTSTAQTDVSTPSLLHHDDAVYFVAVGSDMTRTRLDIWKAQLRKLGVHVDEQFRPGATTIAVASTTLTRDRLATVCPGIDSVRRLVPPTWVIQLLQTKQVPLQCEWHGDDEKEAAAAPPSSLPPPPPPLAATGDQSPPESEFHECSSTPTATFRETERSQEDDDDDWAARREKFYATNPAMRAVHAEEAANPLKINMDAFVCTTSSVLKSNVNAHLTGPFEQLVEYLHVENDEWRENSYKRICSILKQLPNRVTSAHSLQPQHGLNSTGIAKIREILETGTLRKLEAKRSDPRLQVLLQFSNIWGVGPATATNLYRAGYRTLDDLRAKQDEVLTHNQRIGLKHYDDFLAKIPRSEVQEIESVVKQHVHSLLPRAVAITCGSYRRGKSQSGDVDVLISDPTQDDCNIMPRLLADLHAIGFLTDDLTTVEEHKIGGSDSYMGVCRLGEAVPPHRYQGVPSELVWVCAVVLYRQRPL
ncbi:hypothetical protein, variant [Aphanomyces astaci]|uniref:DNA polymerase n=1 Tax=Aphanomyces astaci TaxID=112090 RepID=W4GI18_APHAT|nr:hypothetical protein, variant [Aphanomyces astaci]ETV78946.1 hypothetical protein, variant [Aphanomyces astaci]|eukprot:XP_009831665.1 hypothetical protein, variant [Aphanomyces astaci]